VQIRKSRIKPSQARLSAAMSRRRAEVILDRRTALVAEVTQLRRGESNSVFAEHALELLTRWWARTNWSAREELLKTADWLICREKQRQATKAS
jgi:hypothetical protein